MILFPFILSLCLFVSVQPTHTVARRSNYCQFLFTALRATHKLRIFWSTSFFFCLPIELLLPTFWRPNPALRNSTTHSPQWADMVQMLEHYIYIHRDFRLIYCFDFSTNSLIRKEQALSFVAKLQSGTSCKVAHNFSTGSTSNRSPD